MMNNIKQMMLAIVVVYLPMVSAQALTNETRIGYDAQSRLTLVQYVPSILVQYGYDGVHNRTNEARTGSSAGLPVVWTEDATWKTNLVKLTGLVHPNGASTTVGFSWGVASNNLVSNMEVTNVAPSRTAYSIDKLVSSTGPTNIYYRAWASNTWGEAVGNIRSVWIPGTQVCSVVVTRGNLTNQIEAGSPWLCRITVSNQGVTVLSGRIIETLRGVGTYTGAVESTGSLMVSSSRVEWILSVSPGTAANLDLYVKGETSGVIIASSEVYPDCFDWDLEHQITQQCLVNNPPELIIPPDSDGDGMDDTYEVANGFNPYSFLDAAEDADGDTFSNLDESRASSEPNNASDLPILPFECGWEQALGTAAFDRIKDMAWAHSNFYAVGEGGLIERSMDGNSWFKLPGPSTSTLNDVEISSNLFLVVGDRGTILRSVNGTNWVVSTSGTTQELKSVAFGSGSIVAVGRRGTVLRSADGISWSPVSGLPSNDLNTVIWTMGQFVVGGKNETILRSTNGLNWSVLSKQAADRTIQKLASNGQRIFYLGTSYSLGGRLYELQPDDSSVMVQPFVFNSINDTFYFDFDIEWVGANFVVTTEGSSLISSDGQTWKDLGYRLPASGGIAASPTRTLLGGVGGAVYRNAICARLDTIFRSVPEAVPQGNDITFTIAVSNRGPIKADGSFMLFMPKEFLFQGAHVSQGTYNIDSSSTSDYLTATLQFGDIPVHGIATASVRVAAVNIIPSGMRGVTVTSHVRYDTDNNLAYPNSISPINIDVYYPDLITQSAYFRDPYREVYEGESVDFSFLGYFFPSAKVFQWYFNGAPLSGPTSSYYRIDNVTTNNMGVYELVVGNSFGTLTAKADLVVFKASSNITFRQIDNGHYVSLNPGTVNPDAYVSRDRSANGVTTTERRAFMIFGGSTSQKVESGVLRLRRGPEPDSSYNALGVYFNLYHLSNAIPVVKSPGSSWNAVFNDLADDSMNGFPVYLW